MLALEKKENNAPYISVRLSYSFVFKVHLESDLSPIPMATMLIPKEWPLSVLDVSGLFTSWCHALPPSICSEPTDERQLNGVTVLALSEVTSGGLARPLSCICSSVEKMGLSEEDR